MKKLLLLGLILLFSVSVVSAATIYVPGDYLTIQEAIDNVNPGDVINIFEGSYDVNLIIDNKQNIVIQGSGESTVIEPSSGIGFEITNSNGIAIKNLKIHTTGSNAHGIWIGGTPNGYVNSDNIGIQDNIIIIDGQSSGIYAEQVNPAHSTWTVSGNTISALNLGVDLELYDVDDVTVDGNTFDPSGSVAVVYSSENSNLSSSIFSNNIFNGNGDIAGVTPGFWIESDFQTGDGSSNVDDLTITGNIFNDWTNAAIQLGEVDPSSPFSQVTNVVINQNQFLKTPLTMTLKSYISSVNAENNWWGSPANPVSLIVGNVDYYPWKALPVTYNIIVDPVMTSVNPTVTATVEDDVLGDYSNIVETEFYVDLGVPYTCPEDSGTSLSAVDGSFDSELEDVTGVIDISGLADGTHWVYVHAKDANGNWGDCSLGYWAGFDTDQTLPDITNIVENPTTVYNDNDVFLDADVIDINLDSVWVKGNWNGIDEDFVASGSGTYSVTIPASALDNQEIVQYTWYANDTYGNVVQSALQTFNVENRDPVITPILPHSTNEDVEYTYDVIASDDDVDDLTYLLIEKPTGMIIDSAGTISWTPDDSFLGDHDVTVEVRDGVSAVTESYVLTVSGINDAPEITSIPLETATEGMLYEYQVEVSDPDGDSSFTYTFITNPDPVNMVISSSGYLSWTPDPIYGGTINEVKIQVDDGNPGGQTEQTWNINVDDALDFASFRVNSVSLNNGNSFNAEPGDVLTLSMDVENNMDIYMNNVLVDTSIAGLGLSELTSLFGLEPSQTKTKVLTYEIPYTASIGQDNLVVILSGTDGNGDDRLINYQYTLNLVKQNHLLRIDNVNLVENNLNCFRHTTLDVDVRNIGESNEYDVEVEIINLQLGINEKQIGINIPEDDNELLTFNVDVENEFSGTYPLTVKVTYDSLTVQDTIDLELSKCVEDQTVAEDANGFTINLLTGYTYDPIKLIQSNSDLISCSLDDPNDEIDCGSPLGQGGYSDISFNATGSGYEFENTFRITVTPVNDAPSLIGLPTLITFDEDSSYELVDLSSYVTDVDSTSFTWSLVGAQNIDLSVSGNIATFTALPNWNGQEQITLRVSDGQLYDEEIIDVTVNPIDDSSVITSYSPLYDPKVGINQIQQFSITFTDSDSIPTANWYLDGIDTLITGENYAFSSSTVGTYNVSVQVDGASHEWEVIVTDKPIADTFDGTTTDLENVDVSDIVDLTLEKTAYGKIEYLENVDLTGVYDLDNNVYITDSVTAVNSNAVPALNKKARITMIHQNYQGTPIIYYDSGFSTTPGIGAICDFCTLISYTDAPTSDGTVVFEVDHFSVFWIVSGALEYDELDTCEAGEIGDLEVTIKEPDNGDNFNVGDTVNAEIKVKNNGNDDLDVNVELVLYDLSEGEEIETVESDEVEIEEEDSETFDLDLIIPLEDIAEGDYLLFVKAYEDEDDHCSESMININIERESHDVRIDSFILSPSAVECGDLVSAEVEVENYGKKDEDITISVLNTELGLDEYNEYELDEYDEDDNDAVARFSFVAPNKAGSFLIEAEVDYDDGSFDVSKSLEVSCTTVIEETEFSASDVSGKQGSVVSVPVQVGNPTDDVQSYVLNVESDIADSTTKTVLLQPGQTSTVIVELKVREDAEPGMHTAVVSLQGEEGYKSDVFGVNVAKGERTIIFLPSDNTTFFLITDVLLLIVVVSMFIVAIRRR